MHLHSTYYINNVILLFMLIHSFLVYGAEEKLSDDVISELYTLYKEAVGDESSVITTRRLFKHNKEYYVHVQKLKEVNGYKHHNLLIKEVDLASPITYIDNPVESSLPNAYLTAAEFKKFLTERVINQRIEFEKSKSSKIAYNYKERTTVNKHSVINTDRGIASTDKYNVTDRIEVSSMSNETEEYATTMTATTTVSADSSKSPSREETITESYNKPGSTSISSETASSTHLDRSTIENNSTDLISSTNGNVTDVNDQEDSHSSSSVTEDAETTDASTTIAITRRTTLARPRVFMG